MTPIAATKAGRRATNTLDNLYRAHVAEVYRYAYAMLGNRADAEDVTQTTFVNALRALERGESPGKPSNWLITIAHNLVRQRFRQQQERPTTIELDHAAAVAERPAVVGPTVEELVRGLQRIPHSQREALVMREFEGRSYKEIAAILGLSGSAVETLLFRARRSLADELESLVTCDVAETAISKRMDGRLARRERRRLDAHLRECQSCARLVASQVKHRQAFKGLALLPLPFSLTLFKGVPSASAATGVSAIGSSSAAAAGAASFGTTGGAAGLVTGGLAAKVAVAVASVTLAGGVGYEGAKLAHRHTDPKQTANAGVTTARVGRPAGRATSTRRSATFARDTATTSRGRALVKGRPTSNGAVKRGGGSSPPGRPSAPVHEPQHLPRVHGSAAHGAATPRAGNHPLARVSADTAGRHASGQRSSGTATSSGRAPEGSAPSAAPESAKTHVTNGGSKPGKP